MPLPATSLYAALLALLFVALSLAVIRQRWRHRVALGTGGQKPVERAMRAHANFAEYAPLGLVLLGLLEGMGLPPWAVHALGTCMLAGRVLHGWGISQEPERFAYRQIGMSLTFTMLAVAALALLGLVLGDALAPAG